LALGASTPRNEGGQQAEQLQGSHHQVGGAVGGRALELVGEAAVLAAGEAFQGEGAASAMTTEPLEFPKDGHDPCGDVDVRDDFHFDGIVLSGVDN